VSAVFALLFAFAAFAVESAAPPVPLAVDVAFATEAAFEPGKFVVKFDVLPGHYLYRDRFELQVNGEVIKNMKLPRGKIKIDPNFGQVVVYEQPMSLSAATKITADTELTVVFQGCSALAGVCYPPAKRTFVLPAGAKEVQARELVPINLKQQFMPRVSQ
jgi:thiol:disulfide interchange protein DsbD